MSLAFHSAILLILKFEHQITFNNYKHTNINIMMGGHKIEIKCYLLDYLFYMHAGIVLKLFGFHIVTHVRKC